MSSQKSVHVRALTGSIAGMIAFLSNFVLNVFQVPLILHFWSPEVYGAWLVIVAGTTFLTVFDGGHQGYIGNLVARYYLTDFEKCKATVASAVWFAMLTAGIQILVGSIICFGPWFHRIVGGSALAVRHMPLALFVMMVGWISLGSVSSIIVRLYTPAGLYARSTLINSLFNFLRLAALVFAAWLSNSILVASLVYVTTITVGTLVVLRDLKCKIPQYYPWWKGGSFAMGWANFKASLFLSGTQMLDGLANQGLLVFIGNRFSVQSIPLFTSMRTVANSMMQVTNITLSPLTPDMVRLHTNNEGKKIADICGIVWLLCSVFILTTLLILMPWIEPIYTWWTRGKLTFDPQLFALLALAVGIRCIASPMVVFLQSINNIPVQVVSTLFRAIITLGGAVVLSHWLGWTAIGVTLLAAETVAGFCIYLIYFRIIASSTMENISIYTLMLQAASLIITAIALFIFVYLRSIVGIATPVLTTLMILAGILQWKLLSNEARVRVKNILIQVLNKVGLYRFESDRSGGAL